MGYSFQKCITITNGFQKTLKESHCKPNKIWVNKASKLYNRSIKSWLAKNDMYSKEMCATHNDFLEP